MDDVKAAMSTTAKANVEAAKAQVAQAQLSYDSKKTTFTDGRKFISMTLMPAPLHSSQRPPETLKEKREALKPRTLASGVASKRLRMCLNMMLTASLRYWDIRRFSST